jgi:hypothetical protein
MYNGAKPVSIRRDVRIRLNKVINLKTLFTLFGNSAEETIKALKENKAIHWKRTTSEGRTVLSANVKE